MPDKKVLPCLDEMDATATRTVQMAPKPADGVIYLRACDPDAAQGPQRDRQLDASAGEVEPLYAPACNELSQGAQEVQGDL